MRSPTRSAGVTSGLGLVFLAGAVLHGTPRAVADFVVPGNHPILVSLVGWTAILAGLLLVHVSLHGLSPVVLPAPLRWLPGNGLGRVFFVARHIGIAFLVRWAVGGVLFWAALPLLGLAHAWAAGVSGPRQRIECVLLYLLFYGYGVGGVWNFVGHFFAADMVAASVGWPAGSPFQQELAFCALGMGVVALLAPWLRDRFWIAASLAPSIFVYGAAFTHVEDYLVNGNAASANWSFAAVGANLLIPTVVLSLLWAYARSGGFREIPAGSDG